MVPPHRPYASWRSVVGVTHSSASLQHLARVLQSSFAGSPWGAARSLSITMDCMAMDSPHLGPLSQSLSPPFGHSHNMFDSAGLPSINLDAPPSPGLSDSQGASVVPLADHRRHGCPGPRMIVTGCFHCFRVHNTAVLGELAYEARGWAAAADGEGVTMDVGAFAVRVGAAPVSFIRPTDVTDCVHACWNDVWVHVDCLWW